MHAPTRPPPSLQAAALLAVGAGVLLPALLWLLTEAVFGTALGTSPERQRAAVLLMIAVQGVLTAGLLLWALSRRFVQPFERLVEHVHGLAELRPVAALAQRLGDDFAPLAQELDRLRQRVQTLQTELRASHARLHKAALYDALTGLPNRALMLELFGHEAAAARRRGGALALLRIGLDGLRNLRDSLGHAAGDELVTGLAHRLAAALRDSDFICRDGDDEFLVLLAGPAGWDHVATAAERLLHTAQAPLQLPRSGRSVRVHAGTGIAMYPSDGGDFEGLARASSLALARSRELGQGLHSFYQPALDEALHERLGAERELQRALERGEFELFYQPMLDVRSERLVGCEALLRWRHPRRGLLSPAAFLETARRCRLMSAIDAWVLDAACGDLARWLGVGLLPGRVAVNLSLQQARNPALPEALRDALERHVLSPTMIELEITEDAFLHDPEGVARALSRWRMLGLALTVDDFGVGYSSLSHLRTLRPQRLKIDCSLVGGLPQDVEDCALARAMLAMAAALGIEVLAEGVETPAQRQWLLAQGCALQQGHLHGEPMTTPAFEAWLVQRSAARTGGRASPAI